MNKKPLQLKRVTVYLEEGEYRKLKSKLALQGVSVSEWIRNKIAQFLTDD